MHVFSQTQQYCCVTMSMYEEVGLRNTEERVWRGVRG